MMRHYSFYHAQTGVFSSKSFATCAPTEFSPEREAPQDHIVIEGHHDHLSKRVDLSTGEIVDYIPPQPTSNHVWDEATKRWIISHAYKAKLASHFDALRQIDSLENLTSRFLREQLLGTNEKAGERLRAIEEQIVEHRKALIPELLK